MDLEEVVVMGDKEDYLQLLEKNGVQNLELVEEGMVELVEDIVLVVKEDKVV